MSAAHKYQTFKTTITAVHDGDTVKVVHSDGIDDIVRLIGIDAPEITQPGGTNVQAKMSAFVLQKKVTIETHNRDGHGRILGRINLGKTDVNLWMLANGYAWEFYPQTVPAELRKAYQDAFSSAQANKLGIFADPAVISPSIWRQTHAASAPPAIS